MTEGKVPAAPSLALFGMTQTIKDRLISPYVNNIIISKHNILSIDIIINMFSEVISCNKSSFP